MRHIKWSDDDRHFGPFTYAKSRECEFGFVVRSSNDEGDPGYARLHVGWLTICWSTTGLLVRPHRIKKTATSWDAATIARLGRNWYWEVRERQFGFVFCRDALHTYFGAQTDEWPGSKSKVYFYSWREWRHVRHSLYDLTGSLFGHVPDGIEWQDRQRMEDACPVARFSFADFDGEVIVATCRIEEREWRAGSGWFKWLSLFRRNKISRSLDLRFSSEVGRRKGSWKGGTIGHSIEMIPSELHEAAFIRYCQAEGLTFIGNFQSSAAILAAGGGE